MMHVIITCYNRCETTQREDTQCEHMIGANPPVTAGTRLDAVKSDDMELEKRIFDEGLRNVKDNVLKFVMLKIEHCNATYSVGFSDAQLKYKVIRDEVGEDVNKCDEHNTAKILSLRFTTFFSDGIKLLSDLENADGKFETLKSYEKTAVQILNDFFKNVDHHEESLKKVFGKNPVSETDITITLAEHLLGRLTPGHTYIIDHKVKGKCKCGCGVKPKFGSTGIGHEAVWHGQIDILFSSHLGLHVPSSEVAVKTVVNQMCIQRKTKQKLPTPGKKRKREGDLEESNISPGRKSIAEVKHTTSSSAREQTLAQTIVFSLLQKQKHPDFKNFLVPNILISPEEVQIVMYDAEYDVLLCSNIIKLFDPIAFCLIPETLIILWMVFHYRMFCTGLPIQKLTMLHEHRSRFKELAGAKWDIFSKSLKSCVSGFPVIDKEIDYRTDLLYTKDIN